MLAEEELSVTPAEHVAVHVEDEDGEEDDTVDTDIDIDDPEADAIVNDALNLDEAAESEAAAEVLNESVAEEVAELDAAAADEVTPYDGPSSAPMTCRATRTPRRTKTTRMPRKTPTRPSAWTSACSGQVVRHPLLRRFRAQGEGQHRAAPSRRSRSRRDLPDRGPDGRRGRDQERPAQDGHPRAHPGYVLVRMELTEDTWSVRPPHPGRHRLRGQRPQPDARCASKRPSTC